MHVLAGFSVKQDLPPRSITVSSNIQTFQFPADFFSAIFDDFSPRLQEYVQVLREFIHLDFVPLAFVNHCPQDFDCRAVNITRLLSADLLVLRSEQLNRIACQFRSSGKHMPTVRASWRVAKVNCEPSTRDSRTLPEFFSRYIKRRG